MKSKSELAIVLSRLKGFEKPDIMREQYQTPSEIAAEILWNTHLLDDTHGRWADLACGPGILGIGALLLGAEEMFFIDVDKEILKVCEQNIKSLEDAGYSLGTYHIVNKDVADFDEKVDVVVENPPFGTKQKHADKVFLEKAFSIAKKVYSFHKSSTLKFVESISKDNGFVITHRWNLDFQLPATMEHHRKRMQTIKTSCFRILKKGL